MYVPPSVTTHQGAKAWHITWLSTSICETTAKPPERSFECLGRVPFDPFLP